MHKKSTLASAMLFVCALVFVGFNSSAQSCNSSLSVYKNRVNRSADAESGTRFKLELTNDSGSSKTYTLQAVQPARACNTSRFPGSQVNNTPLDVSFDSGSGRTGSTIVVPAGRTVTFKASVNVPRGTPIGNVACIEVRANAPGCPDGSVATQINVLITDPTDN